MAVCVQLNLPKEQQATMWQLLHMPAEQIAALGPDAVKQVAMLKGLIMARA